MSTLKKIFSKQLGRVSLIATASTLQILSALSFTPCFSATADSIAASSAPADSHAASSAPADSHAANLGAPAARRLLNSSAATSNLGAPASSRLLNSPRPAEPTAKKIAAGIAPSAEDDAFNRAADQYFEKLFRRDPGMATVLGIHDYDNLAPDFSAPAIAVKIVELKSFLSQFEAMKPDSLSAQAKIDLRLIISNIKGRLLMLKDLREWERNPDMYSALSSSMIYDLMSRDFAPLPERLKSVIAREKKIPGILAAAKVNLKNPPKIYVSIAIEQVTGIIDFFQNSVPDTFKSVDDKALLSEFTTVNTEVIAALKDYEKFLKDDLMLRANGNYSYGPKLYAQKLLYDEMVSTPTEQLLADGEKELKRLQSEFDKTAKEIDPSKTPLEVFKSMSLDHPESGKLLDETRAMLNDLRQFCIKNNIVTIPAEGDLKVEETPPFMRALTFAAMNSVGPFEPKAKEAYYYVTLPENSWTPEKVEQHMRSYGKYSLMDTSTHEVFPGHYVQGLWNRQSPSKTTKIIGCNSNIEGWAHYGEQMMVEEGLESGSKKLKLAMLHKALRRACRYIVALRMHTKNMTMDEAIAFFMTESHEEKSNAERESRRGAMDATYLVYTLGKLQINALRDDYKKAKGDNFKLKEFHDQFLSTGCPPVTIIREIMLGKN